MVNMVKISHLSKCVVWYKIAMVQMVNICKMKKNLWDIMGNIVKFSYLKHTEGTLKLILFIIII